MARILVSPLSWGLGHATRDIPVIRELRDRGHDITIAGTGRAFALLQAEFPGCRFIPLPDYPAPYSATRFFLPTFIAGIPKMVAAIARERREARRIIGEGRYDLVISDNRFEVTAPGTPTVFVSHQLRYALPGALRALEPVTQGFNAMFHRRYAAVVVPDNPPGPLSLTGRLSLPTWPTDRSRVHFAGILASVHREAEKTPIDYVVSISGPEPQRTLLEKILLPQLPRLRGRKVVVLGRPEASGKYTLDAQTTVHPHLPRREMNRLLNAARFIITRSGYTTMMELAELGKRRALLIPTPGQTEQEYLSALYARKGWFHSVSQYQLDLAKDVEAAHQFRGFPVMPRTVENARRLYEDVLAPLLSVRPQGWRAPARLGLPAEAAAH